MKKIFILFLLILVSVLGFYFNNKIKVKKELSILDIEIISDKYDLISYLIFSPNSKEISYIWTNWVDTSGILQNLEWVSWIVIKNWKIYDKNCLSNILWYRFWWYSLDWKDFFYLCKENDINYIIENWIKREIWKLDLNSLVDNMKYYWKKNISYSDFNDSNYKYEKNGNIAEIKWIYIDRTFYINWVEKYKFTWTSPSFDISDDWKSYSLIYTNVNHNITLIKDWIKIFSDDYTDFYNVIYKPWTHNITFSWKKINEDNYYIIKEWQDILWNYSIYSEFKYSFDWKRFIYVATEYGKQFLVEVF